MKYVTNQIRKYLLHHAQSFNILNFRYCVSCSYSRNILWLVGKQVFERAKKGSHCWILTYVAFQTLNLATKRFLFAGKGTLYTNQKTKNKNTPAQLPPLLELNIDGLTHSTSSSIDLTKQKGLFAWKLSSDPADIFRYNQFSGCH